MIYVSCKVKTLCTYSGHYRLYWKIIWALQSSNQRKQKHVHIPLNEKFTSVCIFSFSPESEKVCCLQELHSICYFQNMNQCQDIPRQILKIDKKCLNVTPLPVFWGCFHKMSVMKGGGNDGIACKEMNMLFKFTSKTDPRWTFMF